MSSFLPSPEIIIHECFPFSFLRISAHFILRPLACDSFFKAHGITGFNSAKFKHSNLRRRQLLLYGGHGFWECILHVSLKTTKKAESKHSSSFSSNTQASPPSPRYDNSLVAYESLEPKIRGCNDEALWGETRNLSTFKTSIRWGDVSFTDRCESRLVFLILQHFRQRCFTSEILSLDPE